MNIEYSKVVQARKYCEESMGIERMEKKILNRRRKPIRDGRKGKASYGFMHPQKLKFKLI